MNRNNTPSIELSELMGLCETSSLQKGIELARGGAVRRLKVEDDKVSAVVKGSYDYRVSLDLADSVIGHCDCPAAQYQTFCKHCVAVAICLQEQGQAEEVGGYSERSLVKQHLQGLGEEAILEKLLDYLEEDERAWGTMLTKINLSQNTVTYGELKKMVTQSLPRRQIWNWRESGDYFYAAESQLTMIVESMQSLKVEQQWKLINYLVERLNKVLEQIDDSNGDRFAIEELINTHMPAVLAKLKWSEQEKAAWMFERLTSFEFDVFPSIEQHFEAVWQHNDAFLDLCREAIAQAPRDGTSPWDLRVWAKPLIKKASDWREVVAVKQKIARSCKDYLEIVEIYIEHQEPLEAEFWLAKAREGATDYEQQSCDQAQFQLYVVQGKTSAAWTLVNHMFERSPSFNRYRQMARFREEYHVDDPDFIARVEQTLKAAYQAPSSFGTASNGTDALVQFYIERQAWQKGCDWVATRKISADLLLNLADKVVGAMPDNTLSYYLRVANMHIEQTSNEAYATAIALLQRVESMLQPYPESLANFYVEVAALASSNKRKRNMLKLFQQHYGAYL